MRILRKCIIYLTILFLSIASPILFQTISFEKTYAGSDTDEAWGIDLTSDGGCIID
jgi:hypothetical protein